MSIGKPIGYWLQHLHHLLEEHFALVLADRRVTRREWQLLNTLARGPRSRDELEQALAPFWAGGDGPPYADVLASATARGWVAERDDLITFTPCGAGLRAEIQPRVEASRAAMMAGLAPGQYEETVRVLSVMASNVQAAITTHR